MARRNEHTLEQIRSMVLNAAESIVVADGFQALTVRKIALDIGYTVGSIYMVFTNMNDLATHIKGQTLDKLSAQLQQRLLSSDVVAQQIHDLADEYLLFAEQHHNLWRMVFEWPIGNHVTPDWYAEKVEQMFTIVENLFQLLMPNKPVEQSRLAARTLWSAVHGVCILALTEHPRGMDARQAQQQLQLLVKHFILGWQQG